MHSPYSFYRWYSGIWEYGVRNAVINLLTATVTRASSRTVMGFASGAALADGQSLLTVPDNTPAIKGARLATTAADGAKLGGELFTGFTLLDPTFIDNGDGTYSVNNTSGSNDWITLPAILTVGNSYRYTYEIISIESGGLRVDIGGFSTKYSAGIYADQDTATVTGFQILALPNTIATLRVSSVKQVIPTWHTTDINGVPLPVEGLSVADAATNFLYDSANPATQTQSLAAGDLVLSIAGTGSVALSGGPTGTATEGSDVTFNLSGITSVTFTVSGTVDRFQVETGTTASPFILTPSGATASRAADNATIPTPSVLTPESGAIEIVLTPDETGQDNVTVLRMQNGADYLTIKLLPTNVELRVVKDGGTEQVISADYTHTKDTSATIQAHYNTTYGMGLRACDSVTGFPDDTFYESAWLGGVTIGNNIYLGSNNGVTVTKATFA